MIWKKAFSMCCWSFETWCARNMLLRCDACMWAKQNHFQYLLQNGEYKI